MIFISFATTKYRIRQMFLNLTAHRPGSFEQIETWTEKRLRRSGFSEVFPDLRLDERGSGFWAWKPFIIQHALKSMAEGELVLYCDVGRRYPWTLIDRSIQPLIDWMNEHEQNVFPGVQIPWHGPMSRWTKRDAFFYTGSDASAIHAAIPIQASFSLWRKSAFSQGLAEEWLSLCRQRKLVSDDPSTCGLPELRDFEQHRHDQSLWTLVCLRHGLKSLSVGDLKPEFDERNPAMIGRYLDGQQGHLPLWLRTAVGFGSQIEKVIR